MVLRWKRNADSLHVALELRMSCFMRATGLSGMGSIGTERRKLLVMPEEVLTFSLFEVFWHCDWLFRTRETEGGGLQCCGDADIGACSRAA